MRKIIYSAQTTLNNHIANKDGAFWEPFPWGDAEQEFTNKFYAEADTWVMSRKMFEAIVPWWTAVAQGDVPEDVPSVSDADREFARLFAGITKIAISNTIIPTDDQQVFSGDIAAQLQVLKERPGTSIILSVGPGTLTPLLAVPGLIEEMLLVIHPAVIDNGPRLFDADNLTLRLVEATPFEAGAIAVRYEVLA